MLKMNRMSTERLNYLLKATQLDMAESNSKPTQLAFELNIKKIAFHVRMTHKNTEIIKMEEIMLLCGHVFTYVISNEFAVFEFGFSEQELANYGLWAKCGPLFL